MRRVSLDVGVLVLMAGLVHARDYELTKKAGEYTVRVAIDKNPPVTGKNKMIVGIKDGASKDVTDAKVAIDYAMPAMNYKTNTMLQGTTYHAVVDFSMSGPWAITVKITRAGKAQAVKLNVDVK
jgi:hypothetical protein